MSAKTINSSNTNQQNIFEAIRTRNVNLVKASLETLGSLSLLNMEELLKYNIITETDDEEPEHIEILKLLLENNRNKQIPEKNLPLRYALSWKRMGQFKILAQEMKNLGVLKVNLEEETEAIVSNGSKRLFQIVLDSGFYNKKWANNHLVSAYLGSKGPLIKDLIELGADPTLDNSHKILFALNSRVKSFPSDDAKTNLLNLLGYYQLKDLRSIPKEMTEELVPMVKAAVKTRVNLLLNKMVTNKLRDDESNYLTL